MLENFRRFQTEPDPFGRVWDAEFRWQQNGITIRHADTIDVKFDIWTVDEPRQERVIALRHADLLRVGAERGEPLTDAWCMKMAALHLKFMIETDRDMEKTVAAMQYADMRRYAEALKSREPV